MTEMTLQTVETIIRTGMCAMSEVGPLASLARRALESESRQQAAKMHGRALLLEIGGGSEESWAQSDKPYECAAQLADALARCVGYPVYDEETGRHGYPEEG